MSARLSARVSGLRHYVKINSEEFASQPALLITQAPLLRMRGYHKTSIVTLNITLFCFFSVSLRPKSIREERLRAVFEKHGEVTQVSTKHELVAWPGVKRETKNGTHMESKKIGPLLLAHVLHVTSSYVVLLC